MLCMCSTYLYPKDTTQDNFMDVMSSADDFFLNSQILLISG